MSSEKCLITSFARCAWLTNSFLNPIVTTYMNYLLALNFTKGTIRAYLKSLAHFSFWAETEVAGLADINADLIKQFIHVHLPTCNCAAPRTCYVTNARSSLGKLLLVLRQEGYIVDETGIPTSPATDELRQYQQYLINTCGYAETTISHRLKHVGDFLEKHFGDGVVDILHVTPSDIERCMADYANSPEFDSILGSFAYFLP